MQLAQTAHEQRRLRAAVHALLPARVAAGDQQASVPPVELQNRGLLGTLRGFAPHLENAPVAVLAEALLRRALGNGDDVHTLRGPLFVRLSDAEVSGGGGGAPTATTAAVAVPLPALPARAQWHLIVVHVADTAPLCLGGGATTAAAARVGDVYVVPTSSSTTAINSSIEQRLYARETTAALGHVLAHVVVPVAVCRQSNNAAFRELQAAQRRRWAEQGGRVRAGIDDGLYCAVPVEAMLAD